MSERLQPDWVNANHSKPSESSVSKSVIEQRLAQLEIAQNEKIGQHFLVDDGILLQMAQEVESGAIVIEVGAGLGQLTELLIQRANRVVSFEIDRRFKPVLVELSKSYDNLEIVFADALSERLKRAITDLGTNGQIIQIIANLPYHITEPFMHLVATAGPVNMSLMVGERFAIAAQIDDPSDIRYSTLSLLCQSFYEVEKAGSVPREAFVPEPRTQSAILRFLPKSQAKQLSRRDYVMQRLFITAHKSPLVINVLKEAILAQAELAAQSMKTKADFHRTTRRSTNQELRLLTRKYQYGLEPGAAGVEGLGIKLLSEGQVKRMIQAMNIPDTILSKPFLRLNNTEVQTLALRFV